MPTRADVEVLRAANGGAVTLATRDLRGFWSTLNLERPEAARDALLRFTPEIVVRYGEATAVVSADWYDDVRAAERVRPGFRASMAPPVAAERVQATTRFGAQHLFTDDPGQTLAFLTTALSKYVLEPGRETIVESTRQDPAAVGWHRETRPGACNFCRMLAGRGGVYKRATATFSAHGGCRCVAAPSWDPDAPEVPADVYRASERMEALRRRAAAGDRSAQDQLDAHRARIRAAIERHVH